MHKQRHYKGVTLHLFPRVIACLPVPAETKDVLVPIKNVKA
jgi:hypothetical protein